MVQNRMRFLVLVPFGIHQQSHQLIITQAVQVAHRWRICNPLKEVGENLGLSGLWNSCEIAGYCAVFTFWTSKNCPQEQ